MSNCRWGWQFMATKTQLFLLPPFFLFWVIFNKDLIKEAVFQLWHWMIFWGKQGEDEKRRGLLWHHWATGPRLALLPTKLNWLLIDRENKCLIMSTYFYLIFSDCCQNITNAEKFHLNNQKYWTYKKLKCRSSCCGTKGSAASWERWQESSIPGPPCMVG